MTLLFVLGGWWLETSVLEGGGQALARQAGAQAWPASREAEQRLCNIVHELAIAASIRPPQAMVLPREDGINAFATGSLGWLAGRA
ncbi:MAG: peptidase Ste24p, partial [Polaromonas sp.]|nr:peptidase Ste24p [Polaromonas sp.]